MFLLIFETFLGGALRHNVYRGYKVFWGTIIYCSLASVYVLDGTRDITLRYIYACNTRPNELTLIFICKQHDRQITFVSIQREQNYEPFECKNQLIPISAERKAGTFLCTQISLLRNTGKLLLRKDNFFTIISFLCFFFLTLNMEKGQSSI